MTTRTGQKWAAIQPIRRDIWDDKPMLHAALLDCQVFIEDMADAEGVVLDHETWELILPARITASDGTVLELGAAPWSQAGACLRVEGVFRG